MKRVELLIFEHKKIDDFINLTDKYIIANVYIKVGLDDISETRQKLIDLNYTTRLFISFSEGNKNEYIFGKLKKSKGVFNERCKNSIIREKISKIINISSNDEDSVIIDDDEIIKIINKNREWIKI